MLLNTFQLPISQFRGKTDRKLMGDKLAKPLLQNDQFVIQEQCEISLFEAGFDQAKNSVLYLSRKIPYYENSKLIGLLGISFPWTTQKKSPLQALTNREQQCARYLIQGLTTKQIAHYLQVSPRTIDTHIDNIKTKLHCQSKYAVIVKLLGYI
jgi:DNA-binding NarL/FixJ family response regulator